MAFDYDSLFEDGPAAPQPRTSQPAGKAGNLGRFNYDQLFGGPEDVPPEPAKRSAFAYANDAAINIGNSAAALVKSGVDLVAPGGAVSESIEGFIKSGKEKQSDWQKASDKKLQSNLRAADGELDKAGEYIKHAVTEDPIKTVSEAVGQFGPFRALGLGLQAVGFAAPAATKIVMGVAGGQAAGEVRGNILDKIQSTKDAELIDQNQEYAKLRQSGVSEEEAKKAIGTKFLQHLPELGVAGVAGALGGKYGMEGIAAGVGRQAKTRLGAGAISLADEAMQGGLEQAATNVGVKRIDPRQSLTEDVALNMAAEGLPGGITGVIAGPNRNVEEDQPKPPKADTASRRLAQSAFADIAGDENVRAQQEQARTMILHTLAALDDNERKQAVDHLFDGNDALKEQVLTAVASPDLAASREQAYSGGVLQYVRLADRIRRDAGITEEDEYDVDTPSAPAAATAVEQQFQQQGQQEQTIPGVQTNSAGFVSEPLPQLQAQLLALHDGRIGGMVLGVEDADKLNLAGLAVREYQDPETGQAALFVARDDAAVVGAITRADEVGLQQAAGEFKGYIDPTATTVPKGQPLVAVQHVDEATGQIIHEQAVTADRAGEIQPIAGTKIRVLPVANAMYERQQAALGETQGVAPQQEPLREMMASPETQQTPYTDQWVDQQNAVRGLEGDQAVDRASIKEHVPAKGTPLHRLATAIQEALGVKVTFAESPQGLRRKSGAAFLGFNGFADRDSGRVVMNVDGATPLATLGHELAHMLEKQFPQIYARLEHIVLSRMSAATAARYEAGLREALRSENNREADPAALERELRSELVAEAVGEMAQEPGFWMDLFGEFGQDGSQAKSLYDKVMELLSKLAKAFTKAGFISGVKDMQKVRRAATDAFIEWSAALENRNNLNPESQETLDLLEKEAKAPTKKVTAKAKAEAGQSEQPATAVEGSRFDRKWVAARSHEENEVWRRIANGEDVPLREIGEHDQLMQTYGDLAMMRERAADLKPAFDAAVVKIAKLTGTNPKLAAVKGVKRAMEKIWSDYNGDASKIKDLLRATIEFEHEDKIESVIAEVLKAFPGAKVKRNGYEPGQKGDPLTAYRDIFFNVEFRGMVVELQANYKIMLDAKEKYHPDYEFTRAVDKDMPDGLTFEERDSATWLQPPQMRVKYLTAMRRQRYAYGAAFFKILDANAENSSRVIGVKPSDTGSEGRVSRQSPLLRPEDERMKQRNMEQATASPSSSQNASMLGDANTLASTSSGVSSSSGLAGGVAADDMADSKSDTLRDHSTSNPLSLFNRTTILSVIRGNRVAPMAVLDAPTESLVRSGLDRRLPIRMEQSVIEKLLTGKDGLRRRMSVDEVLALKEQIESPVAILDDPTEKGSVVVLTGTVLDGEPLVVAINKTPIQNTYNIDSVDELGRKTRGASTEKAKFSPLKTAYTKDFAGLSRWVESTKIKQFDFALANRAFGKDLARLTMALNEKSIKDKAYRPKEKAGQPLGSPAYDSGSIPSTLGQQEKELVRPADASVSQTNFSRKTLEEVEESDAFDDDHMVGEAAFESQKQKDGSVLIKGDPEEIRALLPDNIKGIPKKGGLVIGPSQAPAAMASLNGESVIHGRAGKVTENARYKSGAREGQYVGAPEKYNTPAKIGGLRKLFKRLALEGVVGRFWYENSGRSVIRLVGGDVAEARKFIALLAIYSPQAKVSANTTFALKAWSQYKSNQPIGVKTEKQDSQATTALYEGKQWGGEKTNNFYRNLLREVDILAGEGSKQGATIDMWMMRAAGYEVDAPTAAAYRFVENETNRVAQELGWEPQQVQAAIWTAIKARTENKSVKQATEEASTKLGYMEKVPGKQSGSMVRKLLDKAKHRALWMETALNHTLSPQDLATAAYHFGSALDERSAQASWEATPGKSTGLLPGIHSAPVAQQLEYLAAIREALTDEKGRDLIDAYIGALASEGMVGSSGWQGEASVGVQTSMPVYVKDGRVSEESRNLIELGLAIRGLVLRQEGMAWHFPLYKGSAYGQNGIEFNLGRTLNHSETAVLYKAISDEMGSTDSPPIPTKTGFRVLYFQDAKFELMTEGLDDGQRKMLIEESRRNNQAFHDAVMEAVAKQPWAMEVQGQPALFESDGDLIGNDWSNGDADYRRAIQAKQGALGEAGDAGGRQGRPDLQEWIDRVLLPKVNAVNERFAEKYGWGEPTRAGTRFSRVAAPLSDADGVIRVNGREYSARRKDEPYTKDGTKRYMKRAIDTMASPAALPFAPDRFFATDDETQLLSMDDIVSSKTDDENQQGSANAPKRFLAAYDGVLQPRDPIAVQPIEGGKYKVIDGNGTFSAFKAYGWKEIPAQVFASAEEFEQAEQAKSQREMYHAFVLKDEDRRKLQQLFPPTHSRVVLDHITADKSNVGVPSKGVVYGQVDKDGLQALMVKVNGQAKRPDGGLYHISVSAADGARTGDISKFTEDDVTAVDPVTIDLSSGADYSVPTRFSRNPTKVTTVAEALNIAATGKQQLGLEDSLARGRWADAIVAAKNASERKSLMRSWGDALIERFADALIPVQRWIEGLPLSESAKTRLLGDMRRADTVRSAKEREVHSQFSAKLYKAVEKTAKASKLDAATVKKLAGLWMTAKYAPKANALLLAKDMAALTAANAERVAARAELRKARAAQAAMTNPTAIQKAQAQLLVNRAQDRLARSGPAVAKAQQDLTDRTNDINGAVGATGFTRGVGGGFNNATAAKMVRDIEAKISPQLLAEVAQPIYDMMAWKKSLDLSSGKVTQQLVNSWPNHADYVPLTGDPRHDKDSADIFQYGNQTNQDADKEMNGRKDSVADDGIDASFTAVMKSINFAAMQDFKRGLNRAYESAQRSGTDIGLKREPVTGIIRNSDRVVIYRDAVMGANGQQQLRQYAFRFEDDRVIDALMKASHETMNRFLEVIATPTRWYGRAVTQWMPMFAPINLVRDVWERTELLRTRNIFDDKGNAIDTDKAARSAIASVINPQLWRATTAVNFNTSLSSPERSDLEEMIRLGGASTWGSYLAKSAKDMEADVAGNVGVAAKAKAVGDVVEGWNNTFEMIAPLSVYRALKAQGVTPKDAAAATLDLMNFRKRGSMMPGLRALYVFAQPAATSGYNLFQYLSTRKGKVRLAAHLVVGIGLYALLRAAWGDDEDEEIGNKLDNLSNFIVERSIPIQIGGMVLKVPVGFGVPQLSWAWAGILNRLATGRYSGGEAAWEIGKSFAKSVSPVAPSDMEIAKRPVDWVMATLFPTVLRPIFSIGADQTGFGTPLTPQFKNDKKMKYEQAMRNTPDFYRDVAEDIHKTFGIDMYPDHIKALVDGYAVGPLREVVSAFISNPAKAERGEPGRIPVVASIIDNINDRQILNSVYYRHRGDLEEVHREWNSRQANGTLEGWETFERSRQVAAYKQFKATDTVFSKMRGDLAKRTDLSDEDRAGKRQAIEEMADQAHRNLLKTYLAQEAG